MLLPLRILNFQTREIIPNENGKTSSTALGRGGGQANAYVSY